MKGSTLLLHCACAVQFCELFPIFNGYASLSPGERYNRLIIIFFSFVFSILSFFLLFLFPFFFSLFLSFLSFSFFHFLFFLLLLYVFFFLTSFLYFFQWSLFSHLFIYVASSEPPLFLSLSLSIPFNFLSSVYILQLPCPFSFLILL